jgi:hypothetical protein
VHSGVRPPSTAARLRDMRPESRDAHPAVEALRIEGFRRMTLAQKFAQVASLTRHVRDLAIAGIRMRHPGIGDRDARLRLAAMTIDPTVVARAFGWVPDGRTS